MAQKAIGYLRVSTARQGQSGLGLAAQKLAIESFSGDRLVAQYVEVESGKRDDRPQLAAALKHCRAIGAVLIVAKLDRLARSVAFVSGLMDSGVEFVAVDCPAANRMTLHILAAVAENEAAAISQRTRAALAAAKARGQQLGNPNGAAAILRAARGNGDAVAAIRAGADRRAHTLADMVRHIQAAGITTLAGMAAELADRGARTARGGKWSATAVMRLLDRLAMAA